MNLAIYNGFVHECIHMCLFNEPVFIMMITKPVVYSRCPASENNTQTDKLQKQFRLLIVIDDFADGPPFTRLSTLRHCLYARGRHTMSSHIHGDSTNNAYPSKVCELTHLYIVSLRSARFGSVYRCCVSRH